MSGCPNAAKAKRYFRKTGRDSRCCVAVSDRTEQIDSIDEARIAAPLGGRAGADVRDGVRVELS